MWYINPRHSTMSKIHVEEICGDEGVPVVFDLVDLVYVHLPSVEPEDVSAPGLGGAQRPEPRVAAEVQDPFPGEGAAEQIHEGVEEIFLPMPVDAVLFMDGGEVALEIKPVVPCGKLAISLRISPPCNAAPR
jgi:hypothetical protein